MRTFEVLERLYQRSPPAPRVCGRVVLLVARLDGGQRRELNTAHLTPEDGLQGDRWIRGRRPDRDRQLTLMNARIAELVADGLPLSFPGDNVLVDLDLGVAALPVGARLRLGTALIEVTAKPHHGCKKFQRRFGADAVRWVNHRPFAARRLRGLNCRVIEAGVAALDDPILPEPQPCGASSSGP